MAATKLLSDNGVTSGITGYQLTGGNDGTLQLQTTTTGGTATTAMTIDTSQNVGIGTSSPTSYGAGTTTLSVSNSSGSGYFDLYNAGARRGYHYATSTTYNVSTTSATSLVFETVGSERMRISSSGNVGIGTQTPGRKLTVSNGGAQGFEFGAGVGASSGNELLNYNRSTNAYIPTEYYASTHTFWSGTAGDTRAMTVDTSGNVGISVTTPSTNAFSVAATKNITFQWSGAVNYANIFNQENSAAIVLGCGVQRSATANGYASSVNVSWARSSVTAGYGFVSIAANSSTTATVGTDVTMVEKLRLDYSGMLTKYDSTTNTYVRDFGCYSVANTYIHFKFNTRYDANKMIGWRLYGYQAYNIFIDTYYGCYLYNATPSSPYGPIVKDAGSASGGAMYYSADGYLCISCQINANNYTGLRLQALVNGGDYGSGIDVAVLAYKGYATATGAY